MYLKEIFDSIDSGDVYPPEGSAGEYHYRLVSVEDVIKRTGNEMIELDDSVLITPFYIDEGAYELYSYEMNIVLVDPAGFSDGSEGSLSRWLEELRENLTLLEIPQAKPFVSKDDLLRYFDFLKASYLLRCDVVSAFKKMPAIENLYLAVY